jgi:hypothetical protein
MDPAQHTGPLSPGFEKLASDFFSGKEVRSVLAYQLETDIPPSTARKNYVISYGNSTISVEERAQLARDEEFCMFMADVVMSNELEHARANNTKYWDAKVVDLKVNDKSEDAVIKAFTQTLRAKFVSIQSNSEGKQFSSEEGNVSAPLDLSISIRILHQDVAESNIIPDEQNNNEFLNLVPTQPSPSANDQSKVLNEDKDGDDWMNTCEDYETEKVPKKAGKKAKKRRNQANKKHPKFSSKFDAEPEEESSITEELETIANATPSKRLENFEDPLLEEKFGNWSVVQAKLSPGPGRALNGSSASASGDIMSSPSRRQTRTAGPLFLQVRNETIIK